MFVSKLFDILKTNRVVSRIIAQRWISVLRDSESICGITVIRRFRMALLRRLCSICEITVIRGFRNATAHCGITAFWFEVARAPCGRMLSCLDICASYCNRLQHTATHCNTLQHTVTHLGGRLLFLPDVCGSSICALRLPLLDTCAL